MKKTLVLSAALLGALSFSMLTGFDSAATVQDVLKNYSEAAVAQEGVTASVTMDIDAALEMRGLSMAVTANAGVDLAASKDPLAFQANGTVSASLLGEEMEITGDAYMVTEDDGTISLYEKTAVSGDETASWVKTTVDASEAEVILAIVNGSSIDLTAVPDAVTLASDPVDVDGTECYALTASFTTDDIISLAQAGLASFGAEDALDDTTAEEIRSLVGDLVLNLELDVSADDYTAKMLHIDLNDSDWTALGALISSMMGLGEDADGNAVEAGLTVNTFAIDAVFAASDAVEVTVPQEAIDSATEESAEDLLEMVEATAETE